MYNRYISNKFISLSVFADCLHLSLYRGILKLVSGHFFVNMAPHISSRHSSTFQGPMLSTTLLLSRLIPLQKPKASLASCRRSCCGCKQACALGNQGHLMYFQSPSTLARAQKKTGALEVSDSQVTQLSSFQGSVYRHLDFIFQTMPDVSQVFREDITKNLNPKILP